MGDTPQTPVSKASAQARQGTPTRVLCIAFVFGQRATAKRTSPRRRECRASEPFANWRLKLFRGGIVSAAARFPLGILPRSKSPSWRLEKPVPTGDRFSADEQPHQHNQRADCCGEGRRQQRQHRHQDDEARGFQNLTPIAAPARAVQCTSSPDAARVAFGPDVEAPRVSKTPSACTVTRPNTRA